MNREEFDELRSEFAEYIYRYEYFLKVGFINDAYYTKTFHEELEPNALLEFENSIIFAALKEKEANKDFDVTGFLNAEKENKKVFLNNIKEKNKRTIALVEKLDKMTSEEKKNIEIKYLDIVKKYHPVVRVFVSEEEKIIYNKLREFYNNNEMGAFDEILSLNVNVFQPIDYKPEMYNNVSGFFYDNQKRINADYSKKSKEYPFNIGEALKDEITIAREKGDLKAKHTELLRSNQDLKKHYKELFGNDFSLEVE